uniref:Uncharacterized protein n=1 Tax=Spiroplasma citri TaxID=2133 RepID=Q14NR5_SPICI|nr:hypothetical protein SPICI04_072 [Spiroplasma citri]
MRICPKRWFYLFWSAVWFTKKDTFDSYTKDKFGEEGQKRLANLAYKLRTRGCYVM